VRIRRLSVSVFAGKGEAIMNIARSNKCWRLCTLLALCSVATRAVAITAPNPLESADWRFEEGTSGNMVNSAVADPVRDSINQNHLDAFSPDTAPTYTTNVPPTHLKSGLANTLALSFTANTTGGGGDDLFTRYDYNPAVSGLAKHINDGIIAPGGGFTVEAAFKPTTTTNSPIAYEAIVGKEGQPGGSRPVQTFVIKTRGDNHLLQVELYDGNGTDQQQVTSLSPILQNQWYYVAAVDDGSTLSLYLDSGSGYQLQKSVPVSGALFQGVPSNPLWDASWTVGRGQFGGNPTDWFTGIIDEVRITNSALTPAQFEFVPMGAGASALVPEPETAALFALALISCIAIFRGRRGT